MYNGGPGGQPPPGQGAGGNPAGQPNNNAAAGGGVPPAGAAAAAAQQHHGMLFSCPGFCIELAWILWVYACGCVILIGRQVLEVGGFDNSSHAFI